MSSKIMSANIKWLTPQVPMANASLLKNWISTNQAWYSRQQKNDYALGSSDEHATAIRKVCSSTTKSKMTKKMENAKK